MNARIVPFVAAVWILLLFAVAPLCAEEKPPLSLKPDQAAIRRWQDMRFGMFIHWGPDSLTGREIGWSRGQETPIEEYDSLYKKFNPTNFDADRWVAIAKAAGVKYIVLTTKHHDGFCLWDTKLTDYNVMHTPFKRDVVRELSAACKRAGIAFCFYYSILDWRHPDYPYGSPGGKTAKPKANMDRYVDYLKGQLKELLVSYGPSLTLWFDGEWEDAWTHERGKDLYAYLRGLQPDLIINNRIGKDRQGMSGVSKGPEILGDYDTPEQEIGAFRMDRPWESSMTISAHDQWAWGGPKDGVKPLATCLTMLIRSAGGDGNMTMNIGPEPSGIIEKAQAERLGEMGTWLAQYGQSIYATRGGPFKPAKQVVSTRHGHTIYLHILTWPEEVLKLPALPAKIVGSRLLTGGQVRVSQTDAGVEIAVPKSDRQKIDTIVMLELDKPALDIMPIAIAPRRDR
jgi:alpha-L-fucosidase